MSRRKDSTYGEFDGATAKSLLSGPGADTRQWISFGTVCEETEESKSVSYEEGQPYVRVRLHPSEMEVNCRVLQSVAGQGEGEWHPFLEHDEVLVAVPQGNERAGCVILGRLSNSLDAMPNTVAGNDTTRNAIAWQRRKCPQATEVYGGCIMRDAKSGSHYGIGPDGSFVATTTDGGFISIGPDSMAMQTRDGDMYFQGNIRTGEWMLGTGVSGTSILRLGKTPGFFTTNTFTVAAGGVQPDQHVALWEGVQEYIQAYVAATFTAFLLVATSPSGNVTAPGFSNAPSTPVSAGRAFARAFLSG
jgi:hypothetical protein